MSNVEISNELSNGKKEYVDRTLDAMEVDLSQIHVGPYYKGENGCRNKVYYGHEKISINGDEVFPKLRFTVNGLIMFSLVAVSPKAANRDNFSISCGLPLDTAPRMTRFVIS